MLTSSEALSGRRMVLQVGSGRLVLEYMDQIYSSPISLVVAYTRGDVG